MQKTSIKMPASYGLLKPETRQRASTIAQDLISSGFDEGVAFSVGVIKMHNDKLSDIRKNSYHLMPHENGWGLIKENSIDICFIETDKAMAVHRARALAKAAKVKLYLHTNAGFRDVESFEVNFPELRPSVRLGEKAIIDVTRSKVLADRSKNK